MTGTFKTAAAFAFTLGSVLLSSGCSDKRAADRPALTTRAGESTQPDLGPPKRIFANKFVSPIYEAPRRTSKKLGYLRAGTTLVATGSRPLGHDGCEGGWFRLSEGGYVCDAADVIAFDGSKLPARRARPPDTGARMPYDYVTVKRPTELFRRLPTSSELSDQETLQTSTMRTASGKRLPLVMMTLQPGFYVSLDRTFDKQGRTFWRTQQNGFIASDAIERKPISTWRGVDLAARGWGLPVAVSEGRVLDRYVPPEDQGAGDDANGQPDLSFIVHQVERPSSVGSSDRWIDVDLSRQTLVAYEGDRAVFVTLISSGKVVAGLDAEHQPVLVRDDHTPSGLFRVRAKHLTATMDGDEEGEAPYYLEDVPYVMYFHGAYAFHASFWHDVFGTPRSHGCVNMSPQDAKWLYNWAGPTLPRGWHGGFATDGNAGSWVSVHGQTPVEDRTDTQ